MKRHVSLVLALLLCIGLAACKETKPEVSLEDMPLNSMRNKETGVTVSLGMSKTEVDRLLGEGTSPQLNGPSHAFPPSAEPYQDYLYGEAEHMLTVTYVADIVRGLTAGTPAEDAPASSNWCVKGGITAGSTKEALFAVYGEREADYPNLTGAPDTEGYLYFYDASGKQLEWEAPHSYHFFFSLKTGTGAVQSVGVYAADPEFTDVPSDSETKP